MLPVLIHFGSLVTYSFVVLSDTSCVVFYSHNYSIMSIYAVCLLMYILMYGR